MRATRRDHSAASALLVAALTAAVAGCFSAELDPGADGVFRCSINEDCPDGQECDGLLCLERDTLATVNILNPEDLQIIADTPTLSIGIGSDLTLVEPGEPVRAGEGYLVVTVDGVSTEQFTAPVQVTATLRTDDATGQPTRGPHRIEARAVRADGTALLDADGDPVVDRRVVWIPDGDTQFVAISKPWPGAEISTAASTIDVEVVTFQFAFAVPVNDDQPGIGHAHIHYDSSGGGEFVSCVDRPEDPLGSGRCDDLYVAVLSPEDGSDERAIGVAQLPTDAAGPVNMGAILRNNTHSPFIRGAPMAETTVIDEITIQRVTPP